MIYTLGPFRLDTQDDLLFRGGEPLALGRRALALLRALVERPGALVSKDALIEAAWPGQAVEESNLTVQIAALRRVLGEVPGGDRWIETMPRRGYRFIAPVATADANAIAPPPIDPIQDPTPLARADAERRQITAMSCELIAMSGRADTVGLEDQRDAIAAFRYCVAATVDRHGGFVVDQLGNAALVLFGYPVAREHDAEQAVRAGLALCAAVGTARHGAGAQCRVGITTGMAIIGDLSPGGAAEGREIVGDAPTLAMQLRLTAQPGIVAIDPITRRLIGGLFDCRDLGTTDAGDGTPPMPVWKVLGESVTASRFEALRGPPRAQLVGREEETNLLLRLWSRATAGEGQVALVSGEAGLGKSRLTVALEERLTTEPHFRLRFFCSPHHQDSSLFPFADQLGRVAGFVRNDTPASRREKLQALLARADLPDEDVAFLLDLLALPLPEGQSLPNLAPARKKQRILQAIGRQLEGLARQQPVVVIFEDAHWIDATSRELLDMIVERISDLKMLLIVTFRPEFQPPWTGQPRVTTLLLNRLDRRDRIALVAQIADGKPLPDVVVAQIVDRTDGVPLFIEEMTKAAVEAGTGHGGREIAAPASSTGSGVPAMLQALLMARLDHLGEPAKRVAQIGAAIGRAFSHLLAASVADLPEEQLQEALRRLIDAGLVLQRGAPPAAEYLFKHALVQEAAYTTLLRPARRQFHARIAAALERLSPELLDTQPEVFAQHYAEAGLLEKSVRYWSEAGRNSTARSALAEAAAQYQKALDQLTLLPDTSERDRRELEIRGALGALSRFLKGQAAPETAQAYAVMRELWERLGCPPEFRHVPYGQSMVHVYRGELDQARGVGEELLRLSRGRNDSAGLVLGHSAAGQSLLLAGRFAEARPHLDRLLAIYDPAVHGTLVHQAGSHPLMTRAFLGLALFCLGWPDQALARSAEAIVDARRLAHPTSLAVSLAIGAVQASLAGDFAALDQRANELTAVATEQGLPFYHAWGAIFRGRVKLQDGDQAGGIALLRDGVVAYRDTGAVMWLPLFTDLLAEGYEAAGHLEEAAGLLDDVLALVTRTGERWFAAELVRHKGQLLHRRGEIVAAATLYREALGIARHQGARLWELRAVMSLARLQCDLGRHAEASDLLSPIRGWFTEGFATADLTAANALLACLQAVPTTTDERVVDEALDRS